ncbi:N-acetyltransferase [Flavobacterium arcticum]|uniref:N-acetyltransferase n=2 Tax=Flavobacterium arcticum TaxID=1784713 RepID=A0A345H856_9FLAO|nr:N-acetyltransferase [Flavobacterium arcticum]KAF2511190.1 GNAT family N-acetyltransferase [Flavobacterium arcticum]
MLLMLQSERLYYRELLPRDDEAMFSLDSDPEVHRYLGNNPVTNIEQSRDYIKSIRQQYQDNGIGRMAVILKETNEFIGWAGLKLEHNVNDYAQFYDVGYRFMKKYWGNGYATESALFFVDYGFNKLKLEKINACAMVEHIASRRALEKSGLKFIENFDYGEGEMCAWYEINNSN